MSDIGHVVYRGPSYLDGREIVGVVTYQSRNPKIPSPQLWILVEGIHPHEAVKTGQDGSVCGDCPLRGAGCYVRTGDAPSTVWNAYRRGRYGRCVDVRAACARLARRGQGLRLGAYGDPAALPPHVLLSLAESAGWATGYTHQWACPPDRRAAFPSLPPAPSAPAMQTLCMASVESVQDALQAWEQGWRTFRVIAPGMPLLDGEHPCPGYCPTCRQCGPQGKWQGITIEAHGAHGRALADRCRSLAG